MDDYISKPIRHTDLAAAIDRWSSRAAGTEKSSGEVIDFGHLLDESVLLELKELEGEDEPDFVEQLLRIFVLETPGRIGVLRRAADRGDSAGVKMTAHQLKGVSRQLGLVAMMEVCQKIEDRGTSGDLGGCEGMLDALERIFQETSNVLHARYALREA